MSLRQSIIDAIVTRMKSIRSGVEVTLSDGSAYTYQTDLGTKVEKWRTRPMPEGQAYQLTIRDTENPKEAVQTGTIRHALTVELDILVAESTPDDKVRKMIEDVSACAGVDPFWTVTGTRLARWTAMREGALMVDESGFKMAGARVVMEVTYDTALWRT